jgi:ribosomal protein S18 acetylase RimI-like enzyme/ADP-ribose pyrophosphatase YjhB (NUDIX family)
MKPPMSTMTIRPAGETDFPAMWHIFQAVVAAGDSYVFAAGTSRDDAHDYFFGRGIRSFVAEYDGQVAGFYKLIPNRRDRGAHVANASFMVDPLQSGRGVGYELGLHCLKEARARAFLAMQFNFVVSTNTRAVALWQRLGFSIVGTLPGVFRHRERGDVDAYVMYRSLEDLPWCEETDVPTFGEPVTGYPYIVRPSGYAVIADEKGRVAIVRGEENTLLPGGGIDPGETLIDAVTREVREECGFTIASIRRIGSAVDVVLSAKERACFEKRSTFLTAAAGPEVVGTPEHEVIWLPPNEAIGRVTHQGHAWALQESGSRNRESGIRHQESGD